MVDSKTVTEIVSLYRKHGWILRRVLLSEGLAERLKGRHEEVFGRVELRNSDIDAAWFSRSSKPGDDTWELRRLSSEAFALCEVFSDEDEEESREAAMAEMEDRLRK
ncbi:MAG: hypothetical protein ACKN97_07800 [Acidobacteriota bacterium]